jgi:hypothetical protein
MILKEISEPQEKKIQIDSRAKNAIYQLLSELGAQTTCIAFNIRNKSLNDLC